MSRKPKYPHGSSVITLRADNLLKDLMEKTTGATRRTVNHGDAYRIGAEIILGIWDGKKPRIPKDFSYSVIEVLRQQARELLDRADELEKDISSRGTPGNNGDLIRVWNDVDEKYETIPERTFDPLKHQRVASQPEGEPA